MRVVFTEDASQLMNEIPVLNNVVEAAVGRAWSATSDAGCVWRNVDEWERHIGPPPLLLEMYRRRA